MTEARRRRAFHAAGDLRGGFTLVEVMVAIAISAMVVAAGRLLLGELGDDAERIAVATAATDGAANADWFLHSLVGQIEVGSTASETFSGTDHEARFTSWCLVPQGWQERCTVTLTVGGDDSVRTLEAMLSTGEHVVLRTQPPPLVLRYLTNAAAGGTWHRSWDPAIQAPLAIGIVTQADTTILRIGDRG